MKFITAFFVFMLWTTMFACNSSGVRLADQNATQETRTLYRNLFSIADRGIMFGHQDATLYGVEWKFEPGRSDVKGVAGDYPAVYGWELGDLELGREMSLDSIPFGMIREHIIAAYERGGVNTVSWHANNPETGGNSWDHSTKTAVSSILPGGKNHAMYREWLTKLGGFFHSLRDSAGVSIPILFRPFHEHTGNWFWWGEGHCSETDYVALWRFTFEFLTVELGVHNLIYVYSPAQTGDNAAKYMERYPGSEYVDVLGIDMYHRALTNYPKSISRRLSMLDSLAAAENKPAVFSETGYDGVPDARWWTENLLEAISGSHISYVLVWRNAWNIPGHFFGPYPGAVSADDFVTFSRDPRMLFEGDLPDMYGKSDK